MEKIILLVSEYLCLYQMELPEYNNIVMKNNAWRNISFAMSAILLQRIFHIIATTASQNTKNKNTLPSQALTAGRFQLALVVTWPDCCYLQLHIQPVIFLIKYFFI